ncbi:RHO1 GDP-GTP exchange protein 2 [Dissophora globulifera]|uniref:RHO1 GDP-GTP exchange protein 2 n=1 Tax=Dissophora globulifera TaxID=979702 RepID=A0A9P6RVL7_9FUNG|nr:RHO1 GDP-GTP exchange protein 2 [Dissophora globulifera]
MADYLGPAVAHEAASASAHASPAAAGAGPAAFPAGASSGNHGYTSAQYVSRHRPAVTQPSGASPLQGPYASQPVRSSPHPPLHGYALSSQQPSQTSSPGPAGSQGFVPPPQRPPVISSPVQQGQTISPAPYSQQGLPLSSAQSPDPYSPAIGSPRYSTSGPPRPGTPNLGSPIRPPGTYIRAPHVQGPPGGPGYYSPPGMRPLGGDPVQGYPADYARGPVRPPPSQYVIRQDGAGGLGGAGAPGLGMGQGMAPGAPGPNMHPRPMRPLTQQQQQHGSGYSIPNRLSTQSLPGWELEGKPYNGNGQAAHHAAIRAPTAAWNDSAGPNGMGPNAMNHRRATSTQIQPTYYAPGEHQGLDRQPSIAARYTSGPYPPSAAVSYQQQQQQQQQQQPYPSSPNRQLVRHQLSDVPVTPMPRVHNGSSAASDGYYLPNATYRKLSISESLDGGRISLDSTASIESGYSNRQPALYPAPNMYGRDSDLSMDVFPPNRQRSASKSSTYSAHSVSSDYYADFDSISAPRSTTPNGGTPQISIQSAQGYSANRGDPFSMRARTPSPGRTRHGSNPPMIHRTANPPVFLVTSLPQVESSRRSAEYVRMTPTQPKISRLQGERSQSFSSYSPPTFDPAIRQAALQGPLSSGALGPLAVKKPPIVYPALLSRVANAFVQRITTSSRIKDSIEYKDCFDGRDAVDKIAFIIKTTDRNLALLLGRALDAQKLFHDVTYDHRLRDSVNELYQFRNKLITGGPRIRSMESHDYRPSYSTSDSMDDADAVNGVFTLLTDCYSSTCTRDRLCYSIACPRRLEQQSRLNLTPNGGLKRALSRSASKEKKDQRLWITSVSKEVAEACSADEKKRQEVIFELIYTEKDFVNDLKYLNDKWITPIRNLELLPESRREAFIDRVFYNIRDVYAVNSKLGESLLKRQATYAVIPEIGDIFLEHVVNFSPFVLYGANQIEAKYEFEHEKNTNNTFSKFVEETERRPESRKLELNGYLTKPTTRLGRYPLLLEAVLKYTPDDNPDKKAIPQVISIIKDFLQKVNLESGKCENAFNLRQINKGLQWKGEPMELNLLAKDRQLIMKGPLKKKGTSSEHADLYVFVFDHVLLLTKEKKGKGGEGYKVHKRPIPLELLTLSTMEEPIIKSSRRTSSLIPHKSSSHASTVVSKITPTSGPLSKITSDSKSGYPIVFTHIGRNGGSFTLYATTHAGRKNWMDKIQKQIQALKTKADSWRLLPVSERFFSSSNKVNCSSTYDNGKRLVIGTDAGVFVGKPKGQFVKIIPRERVSQVDVLEDERILLVLAEKQLLAYGLEALDPNESNSPNKRFRKLGSSVSFFKTGVCQNRTLVGIVKNSSNALDQSSTIKTLEPIEQDSAKKSKHSLRTMLRGGNTELFKLYKDFYIPRETNSLHFLRNTLCVGCSKGFELIDLSNLNTQDLLDFSDPTLDFVHKKDENLKPLAIYRIGTGDSFTFLLCYEEFSFYVDKTGRRARNGWIIHWEGVPTFCALSLPYVIAFDPSFIEIRHVETGDLVQIIPGNNIRCLYHVANQPGAIHVVMTDEVGDFQTITQLCRESQIAGLLDKDDGEDQLPAYTPATIVEEDEEDSYTPEDEKASVMLNEDEDEDYSPMEGLYSHHPSSLSRAVNRLTLDFGDGFDLGSNSPESPQSFQEILDIGSGSGAHSGGSSSSLSLRDDGPTYI